MCRSAVEDLALGQPTFTTSSRVQHQLWDTVPYAHSRPEAVTDERRTCGDAAELSLLAVDCS